MRRVFFLVLTLMIFASLSQAQNNLFECETGERYDKQVELIPPPIEADLFAQYTVSVIGIGAFNPVIGIEAPDIPMFCYIASEQAAFYEMTLPDVGIIPSSPNSVQDFAAYPGENSALIGEVGNNVGEFVILVEGFFDEFSPDSQTFTLPLSDMITNSDVTPAVYLFALTPDFAPALTVTPQEGEALSATPIEADIRLQTLTDLAETAIGVTLNDISGAIQITVDDNGVDGFYALAIHLKTGEPIPGDGVAQITDNEDGSISLTCAGRLVSENAVRVVLPDDDEAYTVTAIGLVSVNPIIGLVNTAGEGFCFDDTEVALPYGATLPTISLPGSISSAQVIAAGAARQVIVGSRDSSSGEFIIMIEGGTVEPDDDGDTFGVHITPYMISLSDTLTTYVIAVDDNLNPALAYVNRTGEVVQDDTGVPYQCDDAGIADNCYGQTPSLRDYNVTLAANLPIAAFEVDALLQIPINDTLTGATFPFQVTASEATAGAYVVIFHIITE